MAAMAAAWRLSEPGWREELESITVYQRGWRLGGKGASSRGSNGRIEEHGLHLWLGYYENSFRLLRECYAELDRPKTDPTAPIRTWRQAMLPAGTVGLEDRRHEGWHHWLGRFGSNELDPGDPEISREFSTLDVLRRSLQLITDFIESLPDEHVPAGALALSGSPEPPRPSSVATGLRVGVLAAILEASAQLEGALDRTRIESSIGALDRAIMATNEALRGRVAEDPDLRRTWHLVAVFAAVSRGMLADGIVADERGLEELNDEDFLDWIERHGAPEEVADFAFIRGLYDLGFVDGGTARGRRGMSAGVAVFLTTKMFLEYRGAIFWKMAAGMGDIVFAPLYEALSRRGVGFEFFHRVDEPASLAGPYPGRDGHRRSSGPAGRGMRALRPAGPLRRASMLSGDARARPARRRRRAPGQPLESHFCEWPDAEQLVLRDGVDYDVLVFGISLGMVPFVCRELLDDRREWRAMVDHVKTTATQAVQLWLREDERDARVALSQGRPSARMSSRYTPGPRCRS